MIAGYDRRSSTRPVVWAQSATAGQDQSEPFAHLSSDDRSAILEILRGFGEADVQFTTALF